MSPPLGRRPARTADRLLGGGIIGLALLMGLGLDGIDPAGGYAGLSARFVPLLVSLGLGLCGLALTFGLKPGTRQHAPLPLPPAQGKALAWVLGALLAHALLIGVIGFPLASALLMVLVARGFGSQRAWLDALAGLALSLPVWWLFTRVLGIHLAFFPGLK